MLEKRTTNSAFQNGQKIATILYLILFCWGCSLSPLRAQQLEYGREINEFNGLNTNVSRATYVDKSGSIWIGTDAGLNVMPNPSEAKKSICRTVKRAQVWGIQQKGSYLYVATFDSGLYQFDYHSGKIIHQWSHQEMPRIRRLRYINECIYVVHGNGVTQISDHYTGPLYPKKLPIIPENDFPMDVFTVGGQIHIALYITKNPITRDENGEWISKQLFQVPKDSAARYRILCGKEINGKTYLGLFVNSYVVIENGKSQIYRFHHRNTLQLAVWDIDGQGNDVYLAIGNNGNLHEGYHWKHQSNGSKFIALEPKHRSKYTWSVSIDARYHGVWWSTVTDGVYFEPHRDLWVDFAAPINGFKITQNFHIAWNDKELYIQKKGTNTWKSIAIKEALIDAIEFKDNLYFLDNSNVFSYQYSSNKRKIISKDQYSSFELHQGTLYLFRIFGMADYLDLTNNTFRKTFNPDLSRVIKTARNEDLLLVQQENSGYYLLENRKLIKLQSDFPSENSKNHFFFIGNKLITQIGNKLRISNVSRFTKSIHTLKEVNLLDLFPTVDINWISTDGEHLIIGNSEIAFVLDFDEISHKLVFVAQYYLGQSPVRFERVQIFEKKLYKIGQFGLQCIPLKKHFAIDYNANVQYYLKGNDLNFETIIARTWEGQSLVYSTSTNNFIYANRGYQRMQIWKEDKLIEDKFIPAISAYVLDNFTHGVYAFHIQTSTQNQHLLFRINRALLYNIGFWFLFLITMGLIGYVVFQYQREKLSLNQKIVSLQLNTLKANLNPHFVFNIMNLIQSLIVKSEKQKALRATGELATLNRLFLETSNKDLITLKEELDFVQKYMSLEQMRFEEDAEINFDIHIDPNIQLEDWYVPPLILQPLLENAMKHGKFSHQGKKTEIKLQIAKKEFNQIHINISNPINKSKRKHRSGTNLGLSLVSDRLALFNERYFFDYHTEFNTYSDLNNLYIASISIEKKSISWLANS